MVRLWVFFKLLPNRYQIEFETLMKDRNFIFDCVNLLCYKDHKINLKRGESNIDSPDWIKSKKGIINHVNNDDKCLQYTATLALNH